MYSTFLGGSHFDAGYGITLDSNGNAYVVGGTSSSDFPITAGVVQSVYAVYRDLLATDRWRALEALGALPQRVLFASTSTKDPNLPDTYYLGRLAAPGTVDTVPEPTLLAFADHGAVCDLLAPDYGGAEAVIAGIAGQGVDVELLAADLQAKGAASFEQSWASLLANVAAKADALQPA